MKPQIFRWSAHPQLKGSPGGKNRSICRKNKGGQFLSTPGFALRVKKTSPLCFIANTSVFSTRRQKERQGKMALSLYIRTIGHQCSSQKWFKLEVQGTLLDSLTPSWPVDQFSIFNFGFFPYNAKILSLKNAIKASSAVEYPVGA